MTRKLGVQPTLCSQRTGAFAGVTEGVQLGVPVAAQEFVDHVAEGPAEPCASFMTSRVVLPDEQVAREADIVAWWTPRLGVCANASHRCPGSRVLGHLVTQVVPARKADVIRAPVPAGPCQVNSVRMRPGAAGCLTHSTWTR